MLLPMKDDTPRDHLIRKLYRKGATITELSHQFDLSYSRIRQLVIQEAPRKQHRIIASYGCTVGQANELSTLAERLAYRQQRNNAISREIPWEFTLISWLLKWDGRLHKRGRCNGNLVMARFGDVGPYSPENTKIVTCNENCSETAANLCAKRGY